MTLPSHQVLTPHNHDNTALTLFPVCSGMKCITRSWDYHAAYQCLFYVKSYKLELLQTNEPAHEILLLTKLNHIGDQRRLRRACASAQSHQSLRCSHTWGMEVDEGSDQTSDIQPHWMAAYARLKNEFTEDEKYHNQIMFLQIAFTVFVSSSKAGA